MPTIDPQARHFTTLIENYAKELAAQDITPTLSTLSPEQVKRVKRAITKIGALHDRINRGLMYPGGADVDPVEAYGAYGKAMAELRSRERQLKAAKATDD